MQQKYAGRGLQLIGVAIDPELKNHEEAVARLGITWPQVCDGKEIETPLAKAFLVPDVPAINVLDRQGRLIAKRIQAAELEAVLTKTLAE